MKTAKWLILAIFLVVFAWFAVTIYTEGNALREPTPSLPDGYWDVVRNDSTGVCYEAYLSRTGVRDHHITSLGQVIDCP